MSRLKDYHAIATITDFLKAFSSIKIDLGEIRQI